jgi:SulP family sulfate permease
MTQKFDTRQILSAVSTGVVGGAIILPLVISFALLIYSGELAPFSTRGIGMILLGGFVMQLVIALTSSLPGTIGGPQDSPSAILGLAAVMIATQMEGTPAEVKLSTVVMTVILTSVISGLFFVFVGVFNLSRLIRFMPYPVVGGFVAGTGLLLVQGAMGVMLGSTPGLSDLGLLFEANRASLWIPGALFGAVLLLASRRSQHFLTYPVLLIGAVILFYITLWARGSSLGEARQAGWLLGPFPPGSLWSLPDFSLLAQVDWGVIAGQASNIAAVALISIVALLLNANALELVAKKDMDLSRELISTGIANILGGLAGSSVGYHHLGVSAIAFRMGITNRLVALCSAAVIGLTLLFGASVLSLVPKFLVGGLIFFVGLSFLTEWLYDASFQLTAVDYSLVWIILIIVGGVGFLEGVGAGLAIAIVLFVVNYSRIDVVKDRLTGTTYQSNVERPLEQRQLIKSMGESIYILRLQGYLFFGTSQNLVNQVSVRIKDATKQKLRFLILDFQHVTALDASATFSFVRLKQLAITNEFFLVFTGLNKAMKKRLARSGIDEQESMIQILPDLDFGMEWCESKLLQDAGGSVVRAGSLRAQLKKLLSDPEKVEKFISYLERQEEQEYHILIRQGDPPDCMYFIDSGEVTTRLQLSRDTFIRLKSQQGGTMVGEMGLFLGQPRSATVVVSKPSVLYKLSLDSYHRMMRQDPDLALCLYQWIGRVLSDRIVESNATLEVLLR